MARQQLMTVQQLRELLAGLPAWQGTEVSCPDGYPFLAGKAGLKFWDCGFGAVMIGEPRLCGNQYGLMRPSLKHGGDPLCGARPWRRYRAGLDRGRRGRAMRRPACHAPLMLVNRLMPMCPVASESLPSRRSRPTALFKGGKAHYLFRSCRALAAAASNRTITTQSD